MLFQDNALHVFIGDVAIIFFLEWHLKYDPDSAWITKYIHSFVWVELLVLLVHAHNLPCPNTDVGLPYMC